jgi:thymidylate synthase ThyX
VDTPEAKALRALAEAGFAGLRVSDLARLLPPDSFEEELVVMADVRAYYHVAYKASLAHHLRFNALITSSSASLTIFLSR